MNVSDRSSGSSQDSGDSVRPCVRAAVGFLDPPHKLYWERIEPSEPSSRPPLLLLPGGAHTGACYRVTPDGRPGWAERFVAQGHTVWMTDWPGQGRCGYVAPDQMTYSFVADAIAELVRFIGDERLVVFTHSMSGAIGWKLLELAPQHVAMIVGVGPGPPGNIQLEPCEPGGTPDPTRAEAAGEVLEEGADLLRFKLRGNEFDLDFTKPAADIGDYLDRHAIGPSTRFPQASRAQWESSITYVPPRLMAQRLNWRGSGLRVSEDTQFTGKHVLIVTGSSDVNHSRADDGGTADFLAQRGAAVEFLWLADRGITGNGHMLMLEDNSDAIADLIVAAIDERFD